MALAFNRAQILEQDLGLLDPDILEEVRALGISTTFSPHGRKRMCDDTVSTNAHPRKRQATDSCAEENLIDIDCAADTNNDSWNNAACEMEEANEETVHEPKKLESRVSLKNREW